MARRASLLSIALLLSLVILLAGCTGTGKTYSKYMGTDGIVIKFLDNTPPDSVYENRPFPVKFDLYDAGAENVSYDNLIVLFSTDPLYIKTDSGISPYLPAERDVEGHTEILGRSEVFPMGEHRLFGIPSDRAFTANPVVGQLESPTAELTATACYTYKTFASAQVCIDTNTYQQNARAQACKQQDVTLSGGQGAPIAITKIEVQALPMISSSRTESVRPQFIIHIEDTGYGTGKGYLVGPDTLPIKSACILKDIPRQEVNAVRVSANLLGTRLICGQGAPKDSVALVRLDQGKAQVTCTVPEEDVNNPLYSATQNFMTTISVNITYIYKTSVTKSIKIQRLLGSRDVVPTGTENGKVAGYAYDGDQLVTDADGNPVEWCNYYQTYPDKIPDALQTKGFQSQVKTFQAMKPPKQFSCSCTQERCDQLGKGTNCFLGLCAGDTQCCTDPPKLTSTGGIADDAGLQTAGTQTDTGAGDSSLPVILGKNEQADVVTANGDVLVVAATATPKVKATVANINKYKLYPEIKAAAAQYGVDEEAILATITLESTGDPNAAKPPSVGLGQFEPAAAMQFGLCAPLKQGGCAAWDHRKDPHESVIAIAKLLRYNLNGAQKLTTDADGQYSLMAAAYNQGLGCVQKSARVSGSTDADRIIATIPNVCTPRSAKDIGNYVRIWWTFYNQY